MNGNIESRVPFADYLKRPGLSISRLKELKRSPQHYQYRLTMPAESAPLTLGTAAHCATLEPERFGREFAIWSKRTAAGAMAPRRGQDWDWFCAQNQDKAILTEDECNDALSIAKAVRSSIAMEYLQAGEPEVTMEWVMQGRVCRGRVDWLTVIDGQPTLVGLKTTRDCRPFMFGKQAAQLGYDMQWAYYFNGYHTITNRKPLVVEIVVESAPPHAVAVYRINDDILLTGEENYCALLTQLDACERDNEWLGPVPEETDLVMPAWYYGVQADDVAELGLEGFI